MNLRLLYLPAALVFGAALYAVPAAAQAAPASPYGGNVVEEIVARINDQVISTSDYDRAMKELDQEERQHGASMQEISEAHKDLLRNLIDQQLWLSKAKELDITGETELVNRLNEIRKQYNLATLEDLEKAAQEQGVSYEDFKANIRNQIITQEVMREEVGRKISITPGETERYFEAHKQDYAKPESVKLAEILVSTGSGDDAKVAAAKAKADDIEAKLHSGADFSQLAKSFSDGTTAATGGDMGSYKRGELNKVFEDATFGLKAGDVTTPIQTKQGFVIFKVEEHAAAGAPAYKDVEQDVEQAYYMSKMEPAMRDYLTEMRQEAAITIRQGYTDTSATPNEVHPTISYSAYTPPSPKKKKKVERTRFRETTRGFRQKSATAEDAQAAPPPDKSAQNSNDKKKKDKTEQASMKPGKKEKIRFGKAPQETLPNSPAMQTEDAGGVPQDVASNATPDNPLEETPKAKKTRYSDRLKEPKKPKEKGGKSAKRDASAPAPPDAAEVADRQQQSAPLGLSGDTSKQKKKKGTTTGEKTRLSDEKKTPSNTPPQEQQQPTPIAPVPGAPAPASAPQNQPQP
ncbi:MAG TPA: peptidylprolyl isomerase [Terracidiphilus sp.]|nr:peptidylprolyl isomerase [Terracidiphilus sp.]